MKNYPIPTVKENVAKIPNVKVFTVVNAKSGYLQLNECSLLTTINTPLFIYRWLKLPFRIQSA